MSREMRKTLHYLGGRILKAAWFPKVSTVYRKCSDVTIGYGGGTHAQNPCKQDVVVGEDASGQLLTPAEKQLTDVYGFNWPYDHEEIFDFLYALHLRRSSPDGGTNFNPAFKGFTLSDYRTLKCFGFRPSRANWREILNFLEAYDRKECKWIECHNYYTFSGCYNAHCPYAHPPPIEIRHMLLGRHVYLEFMGEPQWEVIERYGFWLPEDTQEVLELFRALWRRRGNMYGYPDCVGCDPLPADCERDIDPDFYGFHHRDYHLIVDNGYTPCRDKWRHIMEFLKVHGEFCNAGYYNEARMFGTSCERPDCKLYRRRPCLCPTYHLPFHVWASSDSRQEDHPTVGACGGISALSAMPKCRTNSIQSSRGSRVVSDDSTKSQKKALEFTVTTWDPLVEQGCNRLGEVGDWILGPLYNCSDSAVATSDATCGQVGAGDESDGKAIVGTDTQNGETAKKEGKRKRKNKRRRKNKVTSLAAGGGGDQKEADRDCHESKEGL